MGDSNDRSRHRLGFNARREDRYRDVGELPTGVVLTERPKHLDARGELFEIYRHDTADLMQLRQWNLVRCARNSLRGVHVHLKHADYIVVVEGEFVFGLRDIRSDAMKRGMSAMLRISSDRVCALQIPPGVAHGFWCASGGSIVYGLTHHWDPEDDLGCRWDDPGLALPFPARDPILSQRDASAESFQVMASQYERLRRRLAPIGP